MALNAYRAYQPDLRAKKSKNVCGALRRNRSATLQTDRERHDTATQTFGIHNRKHRPNPEKSCGRTIAHFPEMSSPGVRRALALNLESWERSNQCPRRAKIEL
jgi:hypothetical protein